MLDSRPLWRNYRMRTKWESSQAWLSESIVTQPWVKPHADADCWRHKSLRFVIPLFANLGDLDQILLLDISDWHSTFCKSQLLASADISYMLRDISTSIYALKMLRPGQMSPLPPWLRHCLQDRIISLLHVMHTAKKMYQATKTVILTCLLQNKNRSYTYGEMVSPVPYFSKHSIQSYSTLPVAVASASKHQLL